MDDSIVSTKHAVIMVSRSQLVFRDHSTNGSFYRDQRIEKDAILGTRGVISIPPFDIELVFELDKDGIERKTQYHSHLADMVPDSAPKAAAEQAPVAAIRPEAVSAPPVTGAAAEGARAPSASPRSTRPLPRTSETAASEPPERESPSGEADSADLSDAVQLPSAPLKESGAADSRGVSTLSIAVDGSEESAPLPDSVSATILSPAIVDTQAPALLRLVGSSEGQEQQEVPLPTRVVRLGRSVSADIRLTDNTISRLHAVISPAGEGTFLVTDLDSSNGTYVNDRRIKQTLLQEGDRVRFGEILFRFHLADLPKTPQPRPDEPQVPASSPSKLDIQIEELSGTAVPILRVAIRGTVDTHHYTELSDALDGKIDGGARLLVIDLSQVEYISPTGLGVLVKCLTRLRKLRGDLRLVGLDQRLRDALSLSRVDVLFKGRIAESQEQALQGWLRG